MNAIKAIRIFNSFTNLVFTYRRGSLDGYTTMNLPILTCGGLLRGHDAFEDLHVFHLRQLIVSQCSLIHILLVMLLKELLLLVIVNATPLHQTHSQVALHHFLARRVLDSTHFHAWVLVATHLQQSVEVISDYSNKVKCYKLRVQLVESTLISRLSFFIARITKD